MLRPHGFTKYEISHIIAGIVLLIAKCVFDVSPMWNYFIYSCLTLTTWRFAILPWVAYLSRMTKKITEESIGVVTAEVNKGLEKSLLTVKHGLTNIANANTVGFSPRQIFKKVGDHYGGIAACIKTAVDAETASQVGMEFVKVGSMLGVEIPITNKITSMIAGQVAVAIPEIQQNSIEDCIPLFATAASLAGTQITDVNINSFLKDQANNIRNFKLVSDQIRVALEAANIVAPKNFAMLTELNEGVTALQTEFNAITNILAVAGHELCKPEGRTRIAKFDKDVHRLDALLRSINQPEMKNNLIYQDSTYLLQQFAHISAQVKMLQSQEIRIKPVGICIQGATGIGKSTLVDIFLKKIKHKLQRDHIQKFGRAKAWGTWFAQFRDDFDTGYCGQEIMYMDDAFQAKDNSDHLMWMPFISNLPIGCVMAKEKEKGKPFNSLICMVTTNVLPAVSITAHDINALHTRFPITIRAICPDKKKMPKPGTFDPDFKHLKFEWGPMSEAINLKNKLTPASLDELVDVVVMSLCNNYDVYQKYRETSQINFEDDEEDLEEQADSDGEEEIIDYQPESDPEEEQLSDGEQMRQQRLLKFEQPSLEEEDEEADDEEELEDNARALTPAEAMRARILANAQKFILNDIDEEIETTSRKPTPDYRGEDEINRLVEINATTPIAFAQLTNTEWKNAYKVNRKIGTNLIRAFDSPVIMRPSELGRWVFYLRRRSDKKMFAEVIDEMDELHSANFLRQLTLWEAPVIAEMQAALLDYGAVKVIDHLATEFIWSPLVLGGKYLYPNSLEFKAQVELEMQPWNIRMKMKSRRAFLNFWNDEQARRGFVRMAVATTGLVLPMPTFYQIGAALMQYPAIYYGNQAARALIENEPWPAIVRYNPFTRAILEIAKHSEVVFKRMEASLKIVKDVVYSSFIKVCELVGLEIGPFLDGMAELMGDTALQITIVLLTGAMLYLLWRLIKCLISKKVTREIEEQGGAYDEKRAARKGKKIEKKIRSLRKIQQHANSTKCNDCNKEKNKMFLSEEYDICHNKLEDNSVYSVNWLEYIEDYCEEGTYVGRYYQVQKECGLSLVYKADTELLVQKNEIIAYKRCESPLEGHAVMIRMKVVSESPYEEVGKILSKYKSLNISDYLIDIVINRKQEVYHLDITIYGLNAELGGHIVVISRKNIADCIAEKDNFNKTKIMDKITVGEVVEHRGLEQAVDRYNVIKEHHQVYISKVPIDELDNNKAGSRLFGLGHSKQIICNAHFGEVGQVFRWWKSNKVVVTYNDYRLAIITYVDPVRDIAFARILTVQEAKAKYGKLFKMSSDNSIFPSLIPHLYSERDWKEVVQHCSVLINVPLLRLDIVGRANAYGKETVKVKGVGEKEVDYLILNDLQINTGFSKPGSCGGIVVCTSDKDNRILGFHAASSQNYWYATILIKEDLEIDQLQQQSDEVDDWEKLIVPGEPQDLPEGEEVTFVGRYRGNSLPVSKTSLSHWHHSPWFDQFEEQLQPSPLSPLDPRIEVDLPKNQVGLKSFLMSENEKMCRALPKLDQPVLDIIEKQFVSELSCKLRNKVRIVPSNIDQAVYAGLNGARDNIFVTGLKTNKAAGLPWASLPNGALKSDYLDCNPMTGEVTFNNKKGTILERRVHQKLLMGKQGKRIISLSNSKVKDAPIKISAVKKGKVRVFHSIPADKIITDSTVFGNFKEAYQREFLNCNHAVGVNPHSRGWEEIYRHLSKHPHVFDCDFANYDKFLHRELLEAVFNVINKTIMEVAPDDWDKVREVLKEESIQTYVVDFDTVYKTNRGNKSGEFMTTVVNCIANDILSFYCWIKLSGNEDITSYRDNVAGVFFGDDGVESVSEKAKDIYNYMTVKDVYTAIGHSITPGSKDGVEQPFAPIDQIQFIKRGFKELDGRIVAPLLPRSIESPFVWTELDASQYDIWEGVVREKLYEAVLHGEEYYEEFRNKLSKCADPGLRMHIANLVSVPYDLKIKDYWNNCYKHG